MREFVRYLTYPFRLLARLPASIISAPGRFMGMTLPTRVAIVVAFALLLVSVVYFILKRFDPDPPGFQEYLRDGLIVFALIVVTAIVARMAVKTWLEKDYSRFPEIDQAWNAGELPSAVKALTLSIRPCFLYLESVRNTRPTRCFMPAGFRCAWTVNRSREAGCTGTPLPTPSIWCSPRHVGWGP